LTGPARWFAVVGCFVPVVLGFLLPVGYLLHEVIVRGLLVGFDASLVGYALTTVALASIATAITLVLGFSAVAALRYVKHPIIATSVNVAGIGYAVPGTVLALGLLSPLVRVDEGINALARAFGEKGVGLVLAGSGAALVIAYVIRFLAIAIGFAQAGFSRISIELDHLARLLGAGPRAPARPIHLPPAQPAIFGAALLVFVDCLKELPATLLLRPLMSRRSRPISTSSLRAAASNKARLRLSSSSPSAFCRSSASPATPTSQRGSGWTLGREAILTKRGATDIAAFAAAR